MRTFNLSYYLVCLNWHLLTFYTYNLRTGLKILSSKICAWIMYDIV